MLALAAARLGLKCHVFAPSPDAPAFDVTHRVTCADYSDTAALDRFAADVDVVTYEFENVPADLAAALDQKIGRPAVLKTRRFGYDGKGQALIRAGADLAAVWRELGAQ